MAAAGPCPRHGARGGGLRRRQRDTGTIRDLAEQQPVARPAPVPASGGLEHVHRSPAVGRRRRFVPRGVPHRLPGVLLVLRGLRRRLAHVGGHRARGAGRGRCRAARGSGVRGIDPAGRTRRTTRPRAGPHRSRSRACWRSSSPASPKADSSRTPCSGSFSQGSPRSTESRGHPSTSQRSTLARSASSPHPSS